MVFVPATNVAQVAMEYVSSTQTCLNIYHVLNASAWDLSGLNALMSVFETWESAHMSGVRNDQTGLIAIEARDLTSINGLAAFTGVSPTINGSLTGGSLPNNVTCAIKWTTGHAGRSFRGRTYHIGIDESQRSGQVITNAASTAMASAYVALMTAVNAVTGHQLAVLSARLNGNALNPRVARPITGAYFVDQWIDSQRRRLPAHNIHH